ELTMARLRNPRWLVTGFLFAAVILALGLYATAQQVAAGKRGRALALPRGPRGRVPGFLVAAVILALGLYATAQQVEEGKRDRALAVPGGKFHALPATLETTQWGSLDSQAPPKLVVTPGDTVAVETMMHAHNKITPGTT